MKERCEKVLKIRCHFINPLKNTFEASWMSMRKLFNPSILEKGPFKRRSKILQITYALIKKIIWVFPKYRDHSDNFTRIYKNVHWLLSVTNCKPTITALWFARGSKINSTQTPKFKKKVIRDFIVVQQLGFSSRWCFCYKLRSTTMPHAGFTFLHK